MLADRTVTQEGLDNKKQRTRGYSSPIIDGTTYVLCRKTDAPIPRTRKE